MTEQQALFGLEDFYSFGFEAGGAWREQYAEGYAENYLEHVASEMQARVYHLTRDRFPQEITSAWQQGFRNGAMGSN